MFNRGVIVHISVELIDKISGQIIWKSELFKKDHAGMSGGIFDSDINIKSWLAKCVEDSARDLFNSRDFRDLIKNKS